jgi:hypothetical protein
MRVAVLRRLSIIGLAVAVSAATAAACSDDAGDDATTPDAGAPDGGDAAKAPEPDGALVDASTGPFSCATVDTAALVFCNDFEARGGGAAAPFGFDEGFAGPDAAAGSLAISDEGGITHPSFVLDVALAQTADAGGDAGQAVFLTKDLPGGNAPSSYTHYEVELDFRVVGPASLAYVALGAIAFPAGAIKEHGFAVYDGNVFGRLVPKDFAVKDDKSLWHHARIVLDRAPGTGSFATTIDIDGTLVDNVGGVDVGDTGTTSLRIGAFATSPNAGGAIRVQFDDVVIRRR